MPMIVHRYLVREVVKPLVAVVVLLVCIFMAYSLTRFLADANEGVLNASAVSTLTGLKVLIALEVLIPIALYVGMIVTLGRFYSDHEVTALKAGGVGEGRIVAPVVWLSLAVALVVGLLSLFARPWAYERLYEFRAEAEASAELEDIAPGQFHLYGDEDRMVFLEGRDAETGEIAGLFVRLARCVGPGGDLWNPGPARGSSRSRTRTGWNSTTPSSTGRPATIRT